MKKCGKCFPRMIPSQADGTPSLASMNARTRHLASVGKSSSQSETVRKDRRLQSSVTSITDRPTPPHIFLFPLQSTLWYKVLCNERSHVFNRTERRSNLKSLASPLPGQS